jgi:hypothetical protein
MKKLLLTLLLTTSLSADVMKSDALACSDGIDLEIAIKYLSEKDYDSITALINAKRCVFFEKGTIYEVIFSEKRAYLIKVNSMEFFAVDTGWRNSPK